MNHKILQYARKFTMPLVVGGLAALIIYNDTKKPSKKDIEQIVAELHEKEVNKFRVELHILSENIPVKIPDLYSKNEKFVSKNVDSYWASKVGFRYPDEEGLVKIKKDGKIVAIYGTEYIYQIVDGGTIFPENLIIKNYNGGTLPSSSIFIYDDNHDNILDDIITKDAFGFTKINISRDENGDLTFKGINEEEGARDFLNIYTGRFLKFKIEHSIDQLIYDHPNIFEIREVKPSKFNK